MKKISKFFVVALSVFVLSFAFFCGCHGGENKSELKGEEAILDPLMQNGLNVLGKVSIVDLGTVTYKFRYLDSVPDSAVSMWKIGQWGTVSGFAESIANGTGEEVQEGDNYILRDQTKEVIVNPKTGQYSLNCDTRLEYERFHGSLPANEAWLHMIAMQNLADVSRVSEMENIYADFDFSIDYCEDFMGSDLNVDLHTALFQWVFVVTNVNPDSPDFNQGIWMNIPYYDGRSLTRDEWKQFHEYSVLDHGKEDKTDMFIYMAGSEDYLPENGIEVGERYRITIDLIPYIERAVESVQNNENNLSSAYPVLLNTTLDDLCLTSFYTGWEVPGTFSCGATIYKNSLLYNKK